MFMAAERSDIKFIRWAAVTAMLILTVRADGQVQSNDVKVVEVTPRSRCEAASIGACVAVAREIHGLIEAECARQIAPIRYFCNQARETLAPNGIENAKESCQRETKHQCAARFP